jgi:hypothetical protein
VNRSSLFGLKVTIGTEPEEHALVTGEIVVAGETAVDDEEDTDEALVEGEAERMDEAEGVEEARTELLGAPLQVPKPDLHPVPQ